MLVCILVRARQKKPCTHKHQRKLEHAFRQPDKKGEKKERKKQQQKQFRFSKHWKPRPRPLKFKLHTIFRLHTWKTRYVCLLNTTNHTRPMCSMRQRWWDDGKRHLKRTSVCFIEWGNLWELNSKHYSISLLCVYAFVHIGIAHQCGVHTVLCVWFLFGLGDGVHRITHQPFQIVFT